MPFRKPNITCCWGKPVKLEGPVDKKFTGTCRGCEQTYEVKVITKKEKESEEER